VLRGIQRDLFIRFLDYFVAVLRFQVDILLPDVLCDFGLENIALRGTFAHEFVVLVFLAFLFVAVLGLQILARVEPAQIFHMLQVPFGEWLHVDGHFGHLGVGLFAFGLGGVLHDYVGVGTLVGMLLLQVRVGVVSAEFPLRTCILIPEFLLVRGLVLQVATHQERSLCTLGDAFRGTIALEVYVLEIIFCIGGDHSPVDVVLRYVLLLATLDEVLSTTVLLLLRLFDVNFVVVGLSVDFAHDV